MVITLLKPTASEVKMEGGSEGSSERTSEAVTSDGNRNTEGKKGKKKAINLLRGWPAASLLPADDLRAASQTALSNSDIWVPGLQYGPDPGYQPLREALARWLGRFYSNVVADAIKGQEQQDTDRITITGGASQSLACILQSFTDPSRTLAIWLAAPCYFLACPIFADAGFAGRLRAVPEDDEGVDAALLDREMEALEKEEEEENKSRDGGHLRGYKDPGLHRKSYRHVVYCVPAFSNPSGRTTTLKRRRALVDVARRHDALVVTDDVYDMLQWRVDPPVPLPQLHGGNDKLHRALLPRVVDIDLALGRSPHDPPGKIFGHAVSNGSFSKLVGPGVRTGWTFSSTDLAFGLSRTGSTRSGGAASQLVATIVCELLLLPSTPLAGDKATSCRLDAHIRKTLLPSYARRHTLMMHAITEHLVPLGVSVYEEGGRISNYSSKNNNNNEEEVVMRVYGGYFIWLKLPREDNNSTRQSSWPPAKTIADRCRVEEDLTIGNGEMFAVRGYEESGEEEEGKSNDERFEDAIRLCFAWEDEVDLVDGVQRLGRVVRRMLDEGPKSWEPESTTAAIREPDEGK